MCGGRDGGPDRLLTAIFARPADNAALLSCYIARGARPGQRMARVEA